jgi:hypothetical protein
MARFNIRSVGCFFVCLFVSVSAIAAQNRVLLTSLDSAAVAQISGGELCCGQTANNCIATASTCPDSNYANCNSVSGQSYCQQCKMSTGNFSTCQTVMNANVTCCLKIVGTDPWCGVYWTVGKNMDGTCPGNCANKSQRTCGVQEAKTCILGQNCP